MYKKPLNKNQMIENIERGGYLPQTIGFWVDPSVYGDRSGEVQILLDSYPSDAMWLVPALPGYWGSPFPDYPEYIWGGRIYSKGGAIDSQQLIADWDELDDFLEKFPKPSLKPITEAAIKTVSEDSTGRYRLCHFWYLFYERLWSFRGMENALGDLLLNKDKVHRLFQELCDFYIGIIERIHKETGCDGVYLTDDLGSQQDLMFSPEIFREMFLPYYKKIFDTCHKNSLHVWLHSCGNIEKILPDLIDVGVDVIHPIQKFAMNEEDIAKKYKGRICFMCGMDVQNVMPFGTPDDVRAEVNRLINIFKTNDGRIIFSMGNGVTSNIPVENLYALYDEVYRLRDN
ncbi:MAG: hypothetical protein FWF92_06325 [Oscillospiraceae bacterium]|nr:hypothetical protein [Oscillospiraceae bacterium]